MKQIISKTFQAIFWISLLAGYVMMVKYTIDYDKLITDCTAGDTFQLSGDRYICAKLVKL